MASCEHCGSPLLPDQNQYCCHGCELVSRLIHKEGFDRYYDLRGATPGIPVGDRTPLPESLSWLDEIAERNRDADESRARLHLSGISCVGCVWLIEKLYQRHPGAHRIRILPASSELSVEWEAGTNPLPAFARELHRFGYDLSPLSSTDEPPSEARQLLPRLGACGAFALNAMAFTLPRYFGMSATFSFAHLFELVTLLSATLAVLTGGTYFFGRAFHALRARQIHIDLPISLGLLSAYFGSLTGWLLNAPDLLYFDFVAIFTFLMLGGRYLQLITTERAQGALRKLDALPATIELATGKRISSRDLRTGDEFLLPPGDSAPVAAVLQHSSAEFSLAWMTGEPDPRVFLTNARVPSGAQNLGRSPVQLKAAEDSAQSLAATLCLSSLEGPAESPAQRALKAYLLSVLLLALMGGIFWLPHGTQPALQVVLSILVVSCPCALGVALPMLNRLVALHLQKQGVFIQNNRIWANLPRVRSLVMDKTGTLTLSRPILVNLADLDRLPSEQKGILATLTADSLHPLSRTIQETLSECGVQSIAEDCEVAERPGRGVELTRNGQQWSLEKPRSDKPPSSSEGPCTCFYRGDDMLASFSFKEELRPGASQALRRLRNDEELSCWLFSGDSQARASKMGSELGIPLSQIQGDLSPVQKADLLRPLAPALYLGDGANDALAFEEASVSGAPVVERNLLDRQADFLFTGKALSFLPSLFSVAHWRRQRARTIVTLAVTYNAAAVVICLAGSMTPLLAAILMPISSLVSTALAAAPIRIRRSPLKDHKSPDFAPHSPQAPVH